MEIALICLISLILSYYYIAVPVAESHKIKSDQKFNDTYSAFQLAYVRKHYPELHHMSLEEIRETYDYRSAYHALTLKRSIEVEEFFF